MTALPPGRDPAPRPRLSAGELEARRRTARGRRRRRGVGVATLVVTALVVGLLLAFADSGAHPRRSTVSALPAPRGARPGTPTRPSLSARELRAGRRVLAYTSYIAQGTRRKREVALTFDDGPGPYTSRVLAVLHRFGVTATFFEIGREVRLYPRLTARLVSAGMVVGDHTESHLPLAKLGLRAQASELDGGADSIRAADAPRPLLFRPPYGSFNAGTLRVLRERGMVMVLWTVDTGDYARPGVKRIVYTAVSGARPGAIILFHDGGGDRSQTVRALPRIIERLHQRRYHLVTVPQLLADDPPPVGQPKPRARQGEAQAAGRGGGTGRDQASTHLATRRRDRGADDPWHGGPARRERRRRGSCSHDWTSQTDRADVGDAERNRYAQWGRSDRMRVQIRPHDRLRIDGAM